MIKILITGSNGQLGKSIADIASQYPEYKITLTDIDELDITNKSELKLFFKDHLFDYVVNCAAYTAVDKAEDEPGKAQLLNSDAVKNLAEVCKDNNALLIHISTDYVFDGRNYKPYIENDITSPSSQYGKSKLNGEEEIIKSNIKSIIIRTSWLYSEYGQNFLKTMLKLGKDRDSLNVIYDQIGTPTYGKDLADAILKIIPRSEKINKPEIFNYSNEGVASWYDFAKAIMEISGSTCKINPVDTQEYPLPAPRPPYSVLNKTKIKKHFNINIPYWKDSLKKCIKQLDIN